MGLISNIKSMIENEISFSKFIYYNFLCKNIIRKGKGKIFPHKGAVLDLARNSKIYLDSGSLEIGFNKLKKSKAETYVRLEENAVWECTNGALLFFDSMVDLKKGAKFTSGFFSANSGCVIVVHENITFGNDVMLGRNVLIYDSDFHQLRNESDEPINPPKPVVIEDHVWLTSNITILKGVTIGRDSLVAAQTVINKSIPEHCIIAGSGSAKVIKDYVNWNRAECPHSKKNF